MLLEHLPSDSPLKWRLAGYVDEPWSRETQLLALAVDWLQTVAYLTIAPHSKGGRPAWKPTPLARPRTEQDVEAERRERDLAVARIAYLDQFRPGGPGLTAASPLTVTEAGRDTH